MATKNQTPNAAAVIDSSFNTKAVESAGAIVTTAGDQTSVANVIFRRTESTVPMGGDAVNIMPFTVVMMDKRAPGMYSNALSGPTAKLEWLAELLVRHGQVAEVAKLLMQHDVVAKINERLLRGNARFKQGTVLMSHPTLFKTMIDIVGASNNRNDPKRVAARVATELFAKVYSAFNVIMPYRTVYAQETYDKPIATTHDLIEAAHVATITEALEALKLGIAIKEKEFAPAVIETMLGPVLLAAANRLLAAEKYNRWMKDAACLVGAFLRNSSNPALDNLRDDGNLQILATNASFCFEAMSSVDYISGPLSPVHEHRDILQYAALRLRELRRYESVSMDKFANMYSFYHAKTAKGRTAGVYVTRNLEMTAHSKAIVLQDDADVLVPLNSFELDPYVPMLNEFVNAAFAGATPSNSAMAFASFVIAREVERDPTLTGGRIVGFNITEPELQMLACAHANEIIVSSQEAMVAIAPHVFFGVKNSGTCNYESNAYYNGNSAYTSEPGEVLILKGEDYEGNQRFVTKPQTYAEDIFTGLLDSINPDLYNSATRVVTVAMPLPDGKFVDLNLSLYGLLTGMTEKPQFENYIAVDRQAATIIQAFFALAITAYNELNNQDDATDKIMAEQVATNTHDVMSRFVAPIGFARFLRTLNLQLMASAQFQDRDKRALLTSTVTQHSLAIRLAVTIMMRMGLIPYGMHEDIVRMLTNSKAIERAATSLAFAKVMSARA